LTLRAVLKTFILLSVPLAAFSQTLPRGEAESFVRALVWKRSALPAWFEPGEMAVSRRLGIEYDAIEYKHLIGYDIDDSTRSLLKEGRVKYSIAVDALDRNNSRVTLTTGNAGDSREFYFRGKHWVSPFGYFARKWTTTESKHFRFFLSDSTLFNHYCVEELERFVTRMAGLLKLDNRDMSTLREQKIRYYLCRNEEEIQRLTGFRVRGMYNLAYDAVVTTYNTHYHELLHLLVNYRLRHLPLYTHPFLQEGFAVAYGGRGGLDPGVLLPLGRYLYESQDVELASLLESDGFRQLDPSLSYPAAGLYNKFLVESMGIEPYLALYRKYSSSPGGAAASRIPREALPGDSLWSECIQRSTARSAISLDSPPTQATILYNTETEQVTKDDEWYHFLLSNGAVFPGRERYPHYVSRAFTDAFPGKTYNGDKYMILVTAEQVSVFNLLTNDLIASYAAAFASPAERVPRIGDRYRFSVRKEVFDDLLMPAAASPENDRK
jgi:hypothetical protein